MQREIDSSAIRVVNNKVCFLPGNVRTNKIGRFEETHSQSTQYISRHMTIDMVMQSFLAKLPKCILMHV